MSSGSGSGTELTSVIVSAPYCTTQQVAFMVPALLKGADDFSSSTTPTKEQVTQYINWISTQVNMRFMQAGYKIPFEKYTDDDGIDTWPGVQNEYLTFITALGVAAWAGKYVLTPAPSTQNNKPNRGSIFSEQYESELNNIYDGHSHHLRWRAAHYMNTAAERALYDPRGPIVAFTTTEDVTGGTLAPEKLSLYEYTQCRSVFDDASEYDMFLALHHAYLPYDARRYGVS